MADPESLSSPPFSATHLAGDILVGVIVALEEQGELAAASAVRRAMRVHSAAFAARVTTVPRH